MFAWSTLARCLRHADAPCPPNPCTLPLHSHSHSHSHAHSHSQPAHVQLAGRALLPRLRGGLPPERPGRDRGEGQRAAGAAWGWGGSVSPAGRRWGERRCGCAGGHTGGALTACPCRRLVLPVLLLLPAAVRPVVLHQVHEALGAGALPLLPLPAAASAGHCCSAVSPACWRRQPTSPPLPARARRWAFALGSCPARRRVRCSR